jgi:hypothetical protein
MREIQENNAVMSMCWANVLGLLGSKKVEIARKFAQRR